MFVSACTRLALHVEFIKNVLACPSACTVRTVRLAVFKEASPFRLCHDCVSPPLSDHEGLCFSAVVRLAKP